MGRKCCVTNCNGNYDSKSKEKVFRLPADEDERARWQASISKDSMMGLVYIAGYVTAKDKSDCDTEDSHFYYDKYGSFTEYLNRGGLHVPGDSVCQWVIYSYVMFHEVANHCCRKSLCKSAANYFRPV